MMESQPIALTDLATPVKLHVKAIFAAYLHARITKNWQGKKTAILGSLGFFVIWICYLGVNFLGKGLHSYGFLS